MLFIGIFHHRHMEHPGQEVNGAHGQEGEHQEQGIAILRPGVHQEQLMEFRALLDAPKDFPKPGKQRKRHQDTQPQKGQKFDERLEDHHRHQAFVAFRGLQVPGPEEDAEHGQQQGHIKGGILENRVGQIRINRFMNQDIKGNGDGLELQTDIRDDGQQHAPGGQRPQEGTLAVAQGEKIGHGGQVILLTNAQELS